MARAEEAKSAFPAGSCPQCPLYRAEISELQRELKMLKAEIQALQPPSPEDEMGDLEEGDLRKATLLKTPGAGLRSSLSVEFVLSSCCLC